MTWSVATASVPMMRAFDHALARRTTSESVLLRIEESGRVGWGEAAPRSYVTGETVQSVLARLTSARTQALAREAASLEDDEFVAWCRTDAFGPGAGETGLEPAARAAVGTALLDLKSRQTGRPVHDFLAMAAPTLATQPRTVSMTQVLDLSTDPQDLLATKATGRWATHIKAKVGAVEDVVTRVRAIRTAIPPTTTLSLDANASLRLEDWAPLLDTLVELGVAWIEEPVRIRDWAEMRALRQRGMAVMLDESFTSHEDMELALEHQAADFLNVRVSKCGGPLRAAAMAETAVAHGLGYQVGVQVAELGPLWAAGRALATHLDGSVAREGGQQDRWFATPLTEPPYAVDRDNWTIAPLPGPGLGVTPSPWLIEHLEPATTRTEQP
ncbi:enolase C-terminal domain-like protein [Arachnia propionica]